jgi:hypothetical protein
MAEVKQPGDSEKRSVSSRYRFTVFSGVKISLVISAVSCFLLNVVEGEWGLYLAEVFLIALFSFFIFGFFALLKLHARNEEKTPIRKILADYALHFHDGDLLLVQKRVGDWYFFFYTAIFGVLFAIGTFSGSLSFLLGAIRTPELESILGFLGFGVFFLFLSLTLVPAFLRRHCFLPWKRKILILNRDSVWVKYGKRSDIPNRIEALKSRPDDAELHEILDEEVLQMLKRFEVPSDREAVLEELRMESQRVWNEEADDADRKERARQKSEEVFLEEVEDARVSLQILREGRNPTGSGLSEPDNAEAPSRSSHRGLTEGQIAVIALLVFIATRVLAMLDVEWMASQRKGVAIFSFIAFFWALFSITNRRWLQITEMPFLDRILVDYSFQIHRGKAILIQKRIGDGWILFRSLPLMSLLGLGIPAFIALMVYIGCVKNPVVVFPFTVGLCLIFWKILSLGFLQSFLALYFFLPSRRRILILSRDDLSVREGSISDVPERLEKIEAQPEGVLSDRPLSWDRNLLILQKLCENPADRQTILEELYRKTKSQ